MPPETKLCRSCGTLNRWEAGFCRKCGLPWHIQNQTPKAAPIFVSHFSGDTAWCEKFISILRQQIDADIWWDGDNVGYGKLMGVIQRELRARSIFIAVLSPEAIQSSWVKLEVDAAILLANSDDQRIVLPIAAKQCDPREIPPFWRVFRWICEPNYSEVTPEEAAKRIIRSLALVSPQITIAPVPEKDTETKEGATERGCGLYAQVRYGEALEAYVRALSMDSMYARAWSNKGNTLHKLRQFTDALEAYDQALSLAPQTLAIWLNKGIVLADLGQYEEALSAFDHAVNLSPENAYAWKHKGDELYVRAQYPEALDAYNHVLALEPDYAPAWNCKGNALYQMGRVAEAIEAYGRAAEFDPFLDWRKRT